MITLRELLKDPVYREFFCAVPELPPTQTKERKPWRLLVRKSGETHWRTKRYGTYREAFLALKKILPKVADATINCPSLDFKPPMKSVRLKGQYIMMGTGKNQRRVQKSQLVVWKPKLPVGEHEDHYWCPFCRRPSIFRRMDTHPLMPIRKMSGVPLNPELMRCLICGASENLVNFKNPQAHERWRR